MGSSSNALARCRTSVIKGVLSREAVVLSHEWFSCVLSGLLPEMLVDKSSEQQNLCVPVAACREVLALGI